MLIVRAFGGLGNQMFQYAFYLFLKQKNKNVYFDISDFNIHQHHNGFELNNIFQVTFDEPTKKQLKHIAINHNSIFVRGLEKIGVKIRKISEFEEVFHGSEIAMGQYEEDIYFSGFWQNTKYIYPIEKLVREKFVFSNNLSGKNLDLIKNMSQKNTVAVHVRYGDYIANKSFEGICNESYYNSAIKYVKDRFSNCQFIVFSDDVNLAKHQISFPQNTIYVNWNDGKESYIDMQLMSLCNHNIIANSTFSWWGAWLNQNPHKTVIMPQIWYKKQSNNPLHCPNWILL